MKSLVASSLLLFAFTGCTVGEDCRDIVAPDARTEGALTAPVVERCGLGHCMVLHRSVAESLVLRLPPEPGTFTLASLEARTCAGAFEDCAPASGSLVVREVHSPADDAPVGLLDADLEITSEALRGTTRIDYRETITSACHDIVWPDIGPIPMGPR